MDDLTKFIFAFLASVGILCASLIKTENIMAESRIESMRIAANHDCKESGQ
jgi:hypothetical protein